MADNDQQPQFLGGGPKFNRAGAQPPAAETRAPLPPAAPNRSRAWLIGLAILVLIGLLYVVTTGPNGMTQRTGRGGGISPNQHTIAPDSGAGP